MRLWDTHCHLADDRFAGDRQEAMARALAVGVEAVVVVAADPAAWEAAARLTACGLAVATGGEPAVDGLGAGGGGWSPTTQPRLLLACGLHPHEAHLGCSALWSDLEARLRAPGVVALGEIGLDYHYDLSPRPRQREAFERQLDLAAACDLPVILHEREAAADVLAVLRSTGLPPRGGVWHCFSGDVALATDALALGLHLGFGGLLTFAHGTEAVRRAALVCPAERLLLETDAPYLAPGPHRGRRNEPAFAAETLAFLASLRGQAAADLAEATTRAATRLFAPGGAEGRVSDSATAGPGR